MNGCRLFRSLLVLGIGAACLFLAGCSLNDPSNDTRPRYQYTRSDSLEARDAALWFSGRLEAPPEIMKTHLFNLKNIRTLYKDSLQLDSLLSYELDGRFAVPWVVGEVSAKFDSSSAAQIRNGVYAGWDLLPTGMRPDTIPRKPDDLGWGLFRYKKPYHPRRLAEMYRALPGALSAEANMHIYINFPPNVIPLRVNGEYGYYFVSGDMLGNYGVYFKVNSGIPRFVGRWTPNPTSKPAWYGEIENVLNHFADWDGF